MFCEGPEDDCTSVSTRQSSTTVLLQVVSAGRENRERYLNMSRTVHGNDSEHVQRILEWQPESQTMSSSKWQIHSPGSSGPERRAGTSEILKHETVMRSCEDADHTYDNSLGRGATSENGTLASSSENRPTFGTQGPRALSSEVAKAISSAWAVRTTHPVRPSCPPH